MVLLFFIYLLKTFTLKEKLTLVSNNYFIYLVLIIFINSDYIKIGMFNNYNEFCNRKF